MDEPTPAAAAPPAPPPPRPAKPTIAERFRAAPATYVFAALNVAVFAFVATQGSTTDPATLIRFGAEERGHLWAGQIWRLVTPMFLHIGWVHLLMNTWALPSWCRPVEAAIGTPRFVIAYLAAGIGGTALSVIAQDAPGSAGASGAGFGIIGLTLALRYGVLGGFDAFMADRAVKSTLVMAVLWTVLGLTAVRMNNFAHGGGFLVGVAFGAALLSARRLGRGATYAGFAALVLGLSTAAVHRWPGHRAIWFAYEAAKSGDEALRRDDAAAAIEAYGRAAAAGAANQGFEYNRGLAYERLGDVAAARSAYQRALSAEPDDTKGAELARERLEKLPAP